MAKPLQQRGAGGWGRLWGQTPCSGTPVVHSHLCPSRGRSANTRGVVLLPRCLGQGGVGCPCRRWYRTAALPLGSAWWPRARGGRHTIITEAGNVCPIRWTDPVAPSATEMGLLCPWRG